VTSLPESDAQRARLDPEPRSHLRCAQCAQQRALEWRAPACSCGGLYELVPAAVASPTRADYDQRAGRLHPPAQSSGVWRYAELVLPDLAPSERLSLGEGSTPLLSSPRLARWSGVEGLQFKHEGWNPTGSFKDRGMTVAVSWAKHSGARRVACASTGNTAASLAAYAAAAELEAVVLAPARYTAAGKLAQARAHGARTLLLEGDFDAGMALVRERAEELGLYLVNSINPLRLAGQQSIAYELVQQLGWRAPDWIVLPAGNLGNTSAIGRGLATLVEQGLLSAMPRLAAVQAAGANPFARAFRDDFRSLDPLRAETCASAIRIGAPVSWRRAAQAIQDTRGVVTEVEDEAILAAKAELDGAGIGAEPASCASLAGLRRLVTEGVVQPGEEVVCILTGHLLKDTAALGDAGTDCVIRAEPEALRSALSRDVTPTRPSSD